MTGHHLILGKITDVITGETLDETHDERYRQKIASLLVNQKKYQKKEIKPRLALTVRADNKKAVVPIDFVITLSGKVSMIIKFGPGSLVTRHRCLLAASRLIAPYQIPVVVVTNGEDADILDGKTGKLISTGFENIPSKSELMETIKISDDKKIPENRVEMESRILYAYEVDGSCPCDDTICRIKDD